MIKVGDKVKYFPSDRDRSKFIVGVVTKIVKGDSINNHGFIEVDHGPGYYNDDKESGNIEHYIYFGHEMWMSVIPNE